MREGFGGLLGNTTLWAAIMSWAVAQLIKVGVGLIRTRRIDLSLFVASGGMPSSHTSFVVALTTAIAISEGLDSPLFAVSAVLSLVVMYDAAGVRREAGRHAALMNEIIENLEDTGIVLDKKLKELLGHSPLEVLAGALLGIAVGVLCLGYAV
jgi:acid phosphatase family membrane protein YuiD